MTERELVKHILNGGQTRLFAVIVKKYTPMVFSKVMGLLHDEDETQDVVQQAFVKAYLNLSSWTGASLGPWILAIAYHLALNELQRIQKERAEQEENATSAIDEGYSDEKEERIQRMEAAIKRLSEEDRRILTLHYYDNQKVRDIAGMTGLSQDNVLKKLQRIRERLKKDLENG